MHAASILFIGLLMPPFNYKFLIYNIKERQMQIAIKRHKERPNLIELVKKSGLKLTKKEKENILIYGDIRGVAS
jgi:hypothetical protein